MNHAGCASHLLSCATCSVQSCARTELRTVLVVAYATAAARQVRFPILRASRDAGPTSPNELLENGQRILASALAAKADVFVTGDKDLLDEANEVSGISFADPRGFWNLVKKRP